MTVAVPVPLAFTLRETTRIVLKLGFLLELYGAISSLGETKIVLKLKYKDYAATETTIFKRNKDCIEIMLQPGSGK